MKFIDLFAGMGGMRKGFEIACEQNGIDHYCVFTSEIKPHAINVLKQNYNQNINIKDIRDVDISSIPDFDILLAGFPCQSFSSAGNRLGFNDPRGTLFFDVASIIKEKKPLGFILENVEGLVVHNKANPSDKTGQTFDTILKTLTILGYNVKWKLLNASEYGVPQNRKRVYIIGSRVSKLSDNWNLVKKRSKLSDILETGLKTEDNKLTKALLSKYEPKNLYGKILIDKRGGSKYIHSWDLELKGSITKIESDLLNKLVLERRKKKWAIETGVYWSDGMPLTKEQISTFFSCDNIEYILENLTKKGYLTKRHPKNKINGKRIEDTSLPIGYDIIGGRMSYKISHILDPDGVSPTLTATDMSHLYVIDNSLLRPLSIRECLSLFGYPLNYKLNVTTKQKAYDLLGNTVVIPIITDISNTLLHQLNIIN